MRLKRKVRLDHDFEEGKGVVRGRIGRLEPGRRVLRRRKGRR